MNRRAFLLLAVAAPAAAQKSPATPEGYELWLQFREAFNAFADPFVAGVFDNRLWKRVVSAFRKLEDRRCE